MFLKTCTRPAVSRTRRFFSIAVATAHYAYPQRNGQAELSRVRSPRKKRTKNVQTEKRHGLIANSYKTAVVQRVEDAADLLGGIAVAQMILSMAGTHFPVAQSVVCHICTPFLNRSTDLDAI